MKTLLAIDPSIRNTGYALFRGNVLIESGTLHSKKEFPDAAKQIADQVYIVASLVETLVMEFPVYERSMRGKVAAQLGYTHHLAYLCGLIAAQVQHVRLLVPTPVQSKGQVPKEVTQRRLLDKGYKFRTHDEADAISLGLWALARSRTN